MEDKDKITRRTFIKSTCGALAMASIGSHALSNLAFSEEGSKIGKVKLMEKRELGKTKEKLSIIGFGGIVVCGMEQKDATSIVRESIDIGVNYFDVAPSYWNGEAEEKLGVALEGVRKDVFLACKTEKRKKDEAESALRQSLERLKTDYFDLYQLHAMTTEEDFNTAMGPGGAIEAFIEAKEKGLIRYIGFSAHSAEIAVKLLDSFEFDSVLFPFNWVCFKNGNFGPQVISKAKEKGTGLLALKAMAKTHWAEKEERDYPKCWYKPVTDDEEINLAVRFTLSEPITAAIPPGDARLFRKAVEVVADGFKPLDDEERSILMKHAEGLNPIFSAV